MFFESWWRALVNKFPVSPIRRKRPGASTVWMKVEVLEDRVVPANIYVVGPTAADLMSITSTDPNRFNDGTSSNTLHHVGASYTAPNLRSAVVVAQRLGGNNTILLDSGTYTLNSAYGGEIEINYTGTNPSNALTIKSKTTALATIERSSASLFRLFEVYGGGATAMNYLKLEDGDAPEPSTSASIGGAILNHGKLTLVNDTFLDNQATGYGGGEGGSAQNAYGGAIYNEAAATLTVKNTTFSSNFTRGGSGTSNNANGAGAEGGAIYVHQDSGAVAITASTFSENDAVGGDGNGAYGGNGGFAYGGAVAVQAFGGNHVNIVNSTFAFNSAYGGNATGYGGGGSAFGGAICVLAEDTVTLVNDTIAFNGVFGGGSSYGGSPQALGGGVTNGSGNSQEAGTVQIVNTIIAQSEAAALGSPTDVHGPFTSFGHNLIGNVDGSTGFSTSAPLDDETGSLSGAGILDPGLDPNILQNNGGPTQTIALVITSNEINQAINNGDNGVITGTLANGTKLSSLGIAPLTTDQRGSPFGREVDGHVDIGAFEFQMNLNRFFTLKSSTKTSVTFSVSNVDGLLKGSGTPPSNNAPPTGYTYGVVVTEVGPGAESTTFILNLDGSFTFTVPIRFLGTVQFEFELVLVPITAGPNVHPDGFPQNGPINNGPVTTATNLLFTVTFQVTGGATGRDLFYDL